MSMSKKRPLGLSGELSILLILKSKNFNGYPTSIGVSIFPDRISL